MLDRSVLSLAYTWWLDGVLQSFLLEAQRERNGAISSQSYCRVAIETHFTNIASDAEGYCLVLENGSPRYSIRAEECCVTVFKMS